jgi:hypothetical protein
MSAYVASDTSAVSTVLKDLVAFVSLRRAPLFFALEVSHITQEVPHCVVVSVIA